MKYEIEALDTYERLSVSDKELNEIPKKGKKWIVDKERMDVLLGNNGFKETFVKIINEIEDEKSKKAIARKRNKTIKE